MANLPVPIPASVVPGSYITGALWNANVQNGLSFLLNPPFAYLVQATAQSVANATYAAILFDTEVQDTYGAHSNTTSSSRYTAQVAGTYYVRGLVSFATNATGIRLATLGKNGSYTGQSGMTAAFPTQSTTNGYAITEGFVQLNAGDYVELFGYHTAGAALSTAVAYQCSSLAVWWAHA